MLRVASHRAQRNAQIQAMIEDILVANGTCRRIWAEQHAVVEHLEATATADGCPATVARTFGSPAMSSSPPNSRACALSS
ncbi:hypothetical protein ACH4U6_36015 [Streptomyces netropsis]|uniref:hypothetical protein n=1 Tax=Streptomyces netropsis TaxID=55404 RepID=UPI0037BC44B9